MDYYIVETEHMIIIRPESIPLADGETVVEEGFISVHAAQQYCIKLYIL